MFLLQGSAEDALLGLINQKNTLPVPIATGGLYFGHVKKLTDGTVELPTVTMYDNPDYEGYQTFQYTRINFNDVFGDVIPVIFAVGQTTIRRLLPMINQLLGIDLKPRDIVDGSIDWIIANEQAKIVFKAEADSLGYEGEFVIQYHRLRPLLDVSVTNRSLPVLHHPNDPRDALLSINMLTWGIDFSEYYASLKTYKSVWTDTTAIRNMMADVGFINWNTAGGTVTSYATTDRPDANQNFTNVVIQTGIETDTYKGDAYFHFNRS